MIVAGITAGFVLLVIVGVTLLTENAKLREEERQRKNLDAD